MVSLDAQDTFSYKSAFIGAKYVLLALHCVIMLCSSSEHSGIRFLEKTTILIGKILILSV